LLQRTAPNLRLATRRKFLPILLAYVGLGFSGCASARPIDARLPQATPDPATLVGHSKQVETTGERSPAVVAGGNVNINYTAATLNSTRVSNALLVGYNAAMLNANLAAATLYPQQYAYPANTVRQLTGEINEQFGLSMAIPERLGNGEVREHFATRIAARDLTAAALFRLGYQICLWWQFKGFHGDDVDSAMRDEITKVIVELNELIPNLDKRLVPVLAQHQSGKGDLEHTAEFMADVCVAIMNNGGAGCRALDVRSGGEAIFEPAAATKR
jgi:hypothetical protein